jgi:uncharacterized membrane protein
MTKATTFMLLALAGSVALAAPSEASINRREHRQRERIQHGRESGQLTNLEAARLAGEQAHIRREERRYRADGGGLGPWERADLRHDLNRANRHIYRQGHDGQNK